MAKYLAALSAALFTLVAVAADLKVVGPTEADPFTLVTLRAEGVGPDSLSVRWRVTPADPKNVPSRSEYTPEDVYQFTGKPGTYSVEVEEATEYKTDKGKRRLKWRTASGVVTIKRPADMIPTPTPQPQPSPPQPNPTPVPVALEDRVWIAVVEETDQRTLDTARVLNDYGFWESVRARGNAYAFYDRGDDTAPNPDLVPLGYLQDIVSANVPLPAMLVLKWQSGHRPLEVIPLPKTTAGIDAVIKKWTGK